MHDSMTPSWYSEMRLVLLLLIGFDLSLSFIRIGYSQRLTFVFLIWNLFLALIPYALARLARRLQSEGYPVWVVVIGGLGSVLFLPNAPYLLTDLFHLNWAGQSAPLWLDTLLLFSYAATGLLLFYRSLFLLLFLFASRWKTTWTHLGAGVLIYLTSFGMYLGRYLRFNSWDLWVDPWSLIGAVVERFWMPVIHTRTWGVTLGYGTLLLIGYIGIDCWGRYWRRHYDGDQTITIRASASTVSRSI